MWFTCIEITAPAILHACDTGDTLAWYFEQTVYTQSISPFNTFIWRGQTDAQTNRRMEQSIPIPPFNFRWQGIRKIASCSRQEPKVYIKTLPWQQWLSDTYQNLFSSRSLRGKYIQKLFAKIHRRVWLAKHLQARLQDSAGGDYNSSPLGL